MILDSDYTDYSDEIMVQTEQLLAKQIERANANNGVRSSLRDTYRGVCAELVKRDLREPELDISGFGSDPENDDQFILDMESQYREEIISFGGRDGCKVDTFDTYAAICIEIVKRGLTVTQ